MPHWPVVAFSLLGLFAAAAPGGKNVGSRAEEYRPGLIAVVSDDTMSTPLGAIVDVAVTSDGVVLLLDSQNCNIQRIRLSGEILDPLGRQGEGPGEFLYPVLLAAYPDGRSLVLQDFYARAVCFTAQGKECNSPDVSALRDGYFMTIFVRAQIDSANRLTVARITTRRPTHGLDATPEQMGASAAVVRIENERGGTAVQLFSTDAEEGSTPTVALPWRNQWFVYGGWDVNSTGTLIYADPGGAYRVHIGHPADGPSRVLDLPSRDADERGLRRFIEESGAHVAARDVPRIMSVIWLDNDYFLVQPTAAASLPKSGVVGTFDVFHANGDCLGRFRVCCEYDDANDLFFIRRDLLIVIEGGKSMIRASTQGLGLPEPPRSGAGSVSSSEIRVRVHKLFRDLRGR